MFAQVTAQTLKKYCTIELFTLSKNFLARNQFLCQDTSSCDHSQTAIVKLFVLQQLEFLRIWRRQVKRIETKVSWRALLRIWQKTAAHLSSDFMAGCHHPKGGPEVLSCGR